MKLELLARRRAGQRDGRCQADDDLEGGWKWRPYFSR